MVLVPPVEHTVVDSLRIEEAWAQQQARPGPPGAHVTFILQCVFPQPMPAAAATVAAAPEVGGASQDALVPEGECRSLKGAR